MSAEETSSPKPTLKPVKVLHKRLPSFISLHSDGAWVTVNGDGLLQLNFYSEQPVLTPHAIMQVKPDGSPTGELEFAKEDPIYYEVLRDIQMGVVLSTQAARRVRDVLNSFIAIADSQQEKK